MNAFAPFIRRIMNGKTRHEAVHVRPADINNFTTPIRPLPKNGSISIRDNQIYVTDPEEQGMYGSLWIPTDSHVSITVNGMRVTGQAIITASDITHVALLIQTPSAQVDLQVAADKLSVCMKVSVKPGNRYRIENCEPSVKAIMRVVPQPIINSVPSETLRARLDAEGFFGTVDADALEALSYCESTEERIVLRGQSPMQETPPIYRQLPLQKEYDPLHKKMRVANVAIGTPVAILELGIPGSQGQDVYGEIIEPEQPPSRIQKLGHGVSIVDRYVVSAISGRLLFTNSRIDVTPELVIRHDIAPPNGNIEFRGNLIIHGSILDGSFIKAAGSVTVHGSVCGATIIGAGGVMISGNIVNSTVMAGQVVEVYEDVHASLKQIIVHLNAFYAEYLLLLQRAKQLDNAQKKIPLIANMLLESRHQSFAASLSALSSATEESLQRLDDKYQHLTQYISTKWTGAQRTNIHTEDIECLQNMIEAYLLYIEMTASTEPAVIRGGNVTSSVLNASGSVFINGSTYSSSIESGDSLIVRGSMRGGFSVAQKSARVYELGTPAGVECSIRVRGRDGKVVVGVRHPNTLMEVFGRRDRNLIMEQNVQYKGVAR